MIPKDTLPTLTVLKLDQAAAHITRSGVGRLSAEGLRTRLRKGTGPPVRKISEKCLRITLGELQEWIDSLDHVSRPRLRAVPDAEVELTDSDIAKD